MGVYVGPATVEWSEGDRTRKLEVECRAESRTEGPDRAVVWDGELVDRLGLLVRVAERPRRPVQLRTPHGVGEVWFTRPPASGFPGLDSHRRVSSSFFVGSGAPPF